MTFWSTHDAPQANQYYQGVRRNKTRKIGIEGLIEEIEFRKEDIRARFMAYMETLQETEAMLLGDLDAILECAKKAKERQSHELKEITAAEQFIKEQLKTSNNEMLKKHASRLNNDIKALQLKVNEVPHVQVQWKHLNLCQIISEVCFIPHEQNSNYNNKRKAIISSIKHESNVDYCDCTFDQSDNHVYVIVQFPNDNSRVIIFNRNLDQILSFDIHTEPLFSPWITTNCDSIFITSGTNCPNRIIRVSKLNRKLLVRPLSITPQKSFALDDYLLSTSYGNVVYKFRVSDLTRMEDILLKGINSFGEDIIFSNAKDIQIVERKFYILFNSSTLRTLCCFNKEGILLREVITNPRRLENPTSFCFDEENNIIVADQRIRVFDHYGREIGSFEYSTERFRYGTKAITFNPITNHVILLADYNGKWLHAY